MMIQIAVHVLAPESLEQRAADDARREGVKSDSRADPTGISWPPCDNLSESTLVVGDLIKRVQSGHKLEAKETCLVNVC